MNKHVLYSIFLHLGLLIFLYFAFNLKDFEDEQPKVTVSFNVDRETEIKPEELPQEPEKKVEEKIEPKKEEPKIPPKEVKKPEVKKPVEKPKETPRKEPKKELKEVAKKEEKKELKEAKKEEVKKPAEKKAEEKIEPKKEEIKAPEIAKIPETAKTKEEKKAEEQDNGAVKIAQIKTAPALENTIEKLNLSAREKFNIQNQLKRCYKKAAAQNKSSNILVSVRVTISQDGYIKSNLEEIIDQDLYKNSTNDAYKIAIDNARNAIKFCNPLRNLPADKFDAWKDITLQFDGKND